MTTILLVDDNPNVLFSFKRSLHTGNHNWKIITSNGGVEALGIVGREKVDLIISDLRMPEMDGVELLSRVEALSPSTLRIAISGDADTSLCQQAAVVAHQFIAKPIDPYDLTRIIAQILGISDFVTRQDVKDKILKISNLPSQPSLYSQLVTELNQPEVELDSISAIVSQDISMTAKILQLVNSAYFGLAREVTEVSQAIFYLGIETIRDLAFSVHLFSQFDQSLIVQAGLTSLWDHSLRVATCAKSISASMSKDKKLISSSFTTGLLHDIGKLILGTTTPEFYRSMVQLKYFSPEQYMPCEKKEFGSTHAEVGGFLLGVWGLPLEIIKGVTYHHSFIDQDFSQCNSAIATWFANAYVDVYTDFNDPNGFVLTPEMQKVKILSEHAEDWKKICLSVLTG